MNNEQAERLLEEVHQIRKLIELLAEPAIAERDAKLRGALRDIVGASPKKQRSVMLMDGTRTQAQIVAETDVSKGHLSTMVGQLDRSGLLSEDKKRPTLVISIPTNFFDANPDAKRR
jgi:hypothetical protein